MVTSTLATGLPPSQHGLIAYLLKLPGAGIVNTLFWYPIGASHPLDHDPAVFLPSPNTAERLAAAGREVVVIEPSALVGTSIDQVLYRGARVRGGADEHSVAAAALEEAAVSGRLVVVYLPHVDAAAHIAGQQSDLYASALETVAGTWTAMVNARWFF